jgi:hypothetical protein
MSFPTDFVEIWCSLYAIQYLLTRLMAHSEFLQRAFSELGE